MNTNLFRPTGKPKHKFDAIPCERDGKKFPSKLERRYYDKLQILQKAGEVLFFLRQITLDLGRLLEFR